MGEDTTCLAVMRTPRARLAATATLATGLNLFLGYVGNGALQQPWRLLEVWVPPEHGWAPRPAPTETDDGMGPDVAVALLAPTVAFEIDPLMYAEIPRP